MGDLKNYNLHVYNGDGESDWVLTESNVFFQSSRYDIYSSKPWINRDWMFVLDDDYFAISNNKDDLREFFKKTFYVSDLSEESFYVHVVKENLSEIIRLTSGSEDRDGKKNIDFIHYLDENFKMILKRSMTPTGLKTSSLYQTRLQIYLLAAMFMYMMKNWLK